MKKIQVIYQKITDLKPYENNPRNNDEAVEYVVNSINQFGFLVPIVIDKDGTIVAGHTRYKAARELEMEEIPCITADELTEEQIKAFRLADNKVSEQSDWDFSLLNEELELIHDIDMSEFGFDFETEIAEIEEQKNAYTTKVDIPQYEVTGECPELESLVNTEKTDELIREIQNARISRQEKEFLIQAAKRHNVFHYDRIAEYYAHANPEMQELMEKSALVIIDYNDAIKNGYAELLSDLEAIEQQDMELGYEE